MAINLHLDDARRQRRLMASPPEDLPSGEDAARTAERRMDLAALAAGISELSADEQRLLLDPGPTSSRQEAVRLAVRRHRIRARLAALVEGVVVGLPALRRLLRNLSTPAKAGLAALPIVASAGLLLLPATRGPVDRGAQESGRTAASAAAPAPATVHGSAELIATTVPPQVLHRTASSSPRTTSRPSAAPTSRTVLEVKDPTGTPLGVRREQQPDDKPTLCTSGAVSLCVDRPGPTLPHPDLPL